MSGWFWTGMFSWSWHYCWPKFGRFVQPEPSQNQCWLQPAHIGNHCRTISFPKYGSNEWCYHIMKAMPGWFWTCHILLALCTVAGPKLITIQNQLRLFAASTHRKPPLEHYNFISSISVQWVMLPCYEGYVWLILDMPCSLGIVAGQRFGRFQPEPSQNQDCLQPAQTTAGPFDIFHMDPISDVTMLCRLCVWLILDMPCPVSYTHLTLPTKA